MATIDTTFDSLWINASIASLARNDPTAIIPNGAIGVKNGLIAWIGDMQNLPRDAEKTALEVHDLNKKWVTPGLIDCHTHLIYAGNRANEFAARLNGVSYATIAKNGGGILATLTATREASQEELFELSSRRLQNLLREGITTIEIKSGYGLNLATELKLLRVAKQLGHHFPVTIKTTLLAAHAVPPEFKGRADDYVAWICQEMIPAAVNEKLVDAVDVFCETIGFSLAQTELIFKTAQQFSLPVKIHAEQLSDQQGAMLAARYHALSADHLEYISEEGVKALAKAGTVAVLLPGAFYYLQETRKPPIAWFRQYQVPMAIATDCNPGSSPTTSLLLMMNMACVLFKLTPEEALAGVTCHAAKALGILDQTGTLELGKTADFAVWDIQSIDELAYSMGINSCSAVVKAGRLR